MTELTCTIRLKEDLEDLLTRRSSFSFLENKRPRKDYAAHWRRAGKLSTDIQIIAIGKSGYGKSTTLNTLIGYKAFETSDVRACTVEMQSAEFIIPDTETTSYFSIADLPGIGESKDKDAEYIKLYEGALSMAHTIIYFLKADCRDYSLDLHAFDTFFSRKEQRQKVLIALNAIDKTPPLNRTTPFKLTQEQATNLSEKRREISDLFSVRRANIIPISGLEDINLDLLVEKIETCISPFLEPTT